MTDEWTPLAVNFWRDPKVAGTTKDAKLLALGGFTYCQGQGTDGFIPTGALAIIVAETGAARGAVTELTSRNLWVETADGWMIPSWLEWNKPAAEVQAQRDAKGQGGKWGNHKRWHLDRGIRQPGCRYCDQSSDQLPIADQSVDRIGADSPPSPSPSPSLQSFSQSSGSSPATPPPTDDDDRIEPLAVRLGRADHEAALADGIAIRNPAKHLAACIENRRAEVATVAAAMRDATAADLAAVFDPKPDRANPHVPTWEETQARQAAEAAETNLSAEERAAAVAAVKATLAGRRDSETQTTAV